jgi:hypothetical protein
MKQFYDLADQVVKKYCEEMGVEREKLSKNRFSKKRRRCENGLSLSFIRQSLAHYLYKRLPLNAVTVGHLCGYSDHSMVSLYSRIVENHFEVDDPYFMPYYHKLVEIADPMVEKVNFERISAYHWRSVDKKVLKIRSRKEFFV